MSMTAEMKERWTRLTADNRRVLLRLSLTDPTALTVHVSNTPAIADGVAWDPVLESCVVSCPGGWLTAEPLPATMSVRLTNAGLSCLSGAKASTLMSTHRVVGATVELFLSADDLDFTTHAYRRFLGVVQRWEVERGRIELQCIQRRDFNSAVEPEFIQRDTHPNAPTDSIGSPVPILYGDLRSFPLRTPFATPYPVEHSVREFISGGDRAAAAVLVDTGRGGNVAGSPAVVKVACHKVKQLGIANATTGPFGTAFFLRGTDGKLHVVDPEPANIFNSSTEGAGFKLPDGLGWAYAPVFPVDVRIVTNNAEDPRNILDPRAEHRWATLDYGASKRFLYGKLQSVGSPGQMTNAYAYILYFSSNPLTSARFQFLNPGVGASAVALTASTTPRWEYIDLAGNLGWGTGFLPSEPWDFSSREVNVDFGGAGSPAGQVYVIAMGLVVEYIPSQDLLESERTVTVTRTRPFRRPPHGLPGRPSSAMVPYSAEELMPAVTELRGAFYANVLGYEDDLSGTYTGTASALIERPPDVAHHLLATYAGEAGKVALSGLGSFPDARALLRTWNQQDMKLALHITDVVDVTTVLGWIAASSASWCYLCEAEDVWRFIPWRRSGQAVTYARTLGLDDVLDPSVGITLMAYPSTDIVSGVRIPFSWSGDSKDFRDEVSLSATRSSAGRKYLGIRSQDLLVKVNDNDRLDVHYSGVTTTVQLAAGSSGYQGVLAALKTVLSPAPPTASLHGLTWSCSFGGFVPATVFNQLEADNSSSVFVAVTLAANRYATMEDQAADTQAQLRAATADNRWTVTYSRSTRKFTFGKGGASCQLRFSGTGAGIYRNNAAACFGFKPALYSGTSLVSDYAIEEAMFMLTTPLTVELRWATGPYGLKGVNGLKNAAQLLGFDHDHDTTAPPYSGLSPKWGREQDLGVMATKYGPKRDMTVDGRALYDGATALELLNRVADLSATTPPLFIRFNSGRLADMLRGDVFSVSAAWDSMTPYPGAGGSWAGRKFMALELVQHASPNTHTEVMAVEV